jgi:hypothetical protein
MALHPLHWRSSMSLHTKLFRRGWVLYKKLSTVFDEVPKKINYMIICAKGIPLEKANHNLKKQ